jgi:hypothetical protein
MNPNVPFNPSDRRPMFGTPTQNAPTPRPPVTDQGQQNQQGQAPQRSGILDGLPAFGHGRIMAFLRAKNARQAPVAPAVAAAPTQPQPRQDMPANRGLLNGGLLDRFNPATPPATQAQPIWRSQPMTPLNPQRINP